MRTAEHGVTLVELIVAIGIISILLAIGAPAFSSWTQNGQIRTTADAIQNGLQLARTEALKNNAQAIFSLTTSVDDGCAIYVAGATGVAANWTVSSSDPTGACGTGAQVSSKRAATEGTSNALVTVTQNAAVHTGQIIFNGLGRITPLPANDVWFDVTNPAGGACGTAPGNMTCFRVVVSPAGNIRLCKSALAYSLNQLQGC